ncbi:MAG TPA: hypothetical protein VMD29_04350, partial [Terracidiphilus sp.]|nr:hypothetical protein [Terracidiphilus sp.]
TEHGDLPGQFKALVNVAIDKQNRVFTTEQYPGRMQVFQYVTDAEAANEQAQRDEELKKAADRRAKAATPAAPDKAAPPQNAPTPAPPNGSAAAKAPQP